MAQIVTDSIAKRTNKSIYINLCFSVVFLALIFVTNIVLLSDDIVDNHMFNKFAKVMSSIWGGVSSLFIISITLSFFHFRKIHNKNLDLYVKNKFITFFNNVCPISGGVYSISAVVFSIELGTANGGDEEKNIWMIFCFIAYFLMLYLILLNVFANIYSRARQDAIIKNILLSNYHFASSVSEKKVSKALYKQQSDGKNITKKDEARLKKQLKKTHGN